MNTNNYNLPYPAITDVANIPTDLQLLAETIDTVLKNLQPDVLYDRTGVEGSNLNKTAGIKGTESVEIDMSNFKRIEIFGIVNPRSHQFCIKIDLNDGLSTYNNVSKYYGRSMLKDISLTPDEAAVFCVDVSVSQDKQTFKAENFGFISEAHVVALRNNNANYVVTKIIGYK